MAETDVIDEYLGSSLENLRGARQFIEDCPVVNGTQKGEELLEGLQKLILQTIWLRDKLHSTVNGE